MAYRDASSGYSGVFELSKADTPQSANIKQLVSSPSSASKASDFEDPYNFQAEVVDGWRVPEWLNVITSMFGYDYNKEYDALIAQDNRNYERASTQSARAWEEYYAKNIAKWQAEGLKAAGLNPWLAVQGGSFNGSTAHSAQANANGISRKDTGSSSTLKKATDGISSALKMLFFLALLG